MSHKIDWTARCLRYVPKVAIAVRTSLQAVRKMNRTNYNPNGIEALELVRDNLTEEIKLLRAMHMPKTEKPVVNPDPEPEHSDVSDYEDRFEAIEEIGLPDNEAECSALKKGKEILSVIYSGANTEAIQYLGLPATQAEADDKYTKAELVEFLYSEEE